jgi:hypothetical protein
VTTDERIDRPMKRGLVLTVAVLLVAATLAAVIGPGHCADYPRVGAATG